jgi:hypothetical protein
MATQDREDNGLGRVPLQSAMSGSWPYGWIVYTWIIIAAKGLVQLKNLFWLKCSLGPCLDDANTTQHLSHLGRVLQAVCHLYSGS